MPSRRRTFTYVPRNTVADDCLAMVRFDSFENSNFPFRIVFSSAHSQHKDAHVRCAGDANYVIMKTCGFRAAPFVCLDTVAVIRAANIHIHSLCIANYGDLSTALLSRA